MLVNKAEAAKLVCPFSTGFSANNTMAKEDLKAQLGEDATKDWVRASTCLGPRCMAWDWVDPEEEIIYLERLRELTNNPDHKTITDLDEQTLEEFGLHYATGRIMSLRRRRTQEERKGKCSRTWHEIDVNVNNG